MKETNLSDGMTFDELVERNGGIELDAGMADLITTLMDYAKKEPATAVILGEIVTDAMHRSTMQTYLASLHPKYIAFLASMAQTNNLTKSAEKAGISRRWAWEHLHRKPEAMAAYAEICQIVNEELLQQAIMDYITRTLLPHFIVDAMVEAQKRIRREKEQNTTPISEQIQKLRQKEQASGTSSNGSNFFEHNVPH